jgi:osmotically-inducible protein OsmY
LRTRRIVPRRDAGRMEETMEPLTQHEPALLPPGEARQPAANRRRPSVEEENLAVRIERRIRRATDDRVHELRVEVATGQVVLRGRCGTFYTKQLAQQAVLSLSARARLMNQIEVW